MDALINYIESIVRLSPEAINELLLRAEKEQVKRQAFILEAGQRCHKIWFLVRGMVRKYYLHNGKEITTWIHTENETFTSLQSYAQRIPAPEYLQACEDSVIIGITRSHSEKLIQFPEFVTFSNTLMEQEFAKIDRHTRELNARDARGKYQYLCQIAPELAKRAKLGHIASILGVSQETLSRIRKG